MVIIQVVIIVVWGTVGVECSVEAITNVQAWVEEVTTTRHHITDHHTVTVRPAVDPDHAATVDRDPGAGLVYYPYTLSKH